MNSNSFYEGLDVKYKHNIGKIRFICDSYVTICVNTYDHRSRDVCILVSRHRWNEISLLKESEK
jgi:hypothetical protein